VEGPRILTRWWERVQTNITATITATNANPTTHSADAEKLQFQFLITVSP
jgi:hypothetical protein